jgi:UDP-glucuronate decarboxylase
VIYGDESFEQSLCYVTDVVDGLARLMKADLEVYLVNLGHDTIYKMRDVAEMIIKMTNSSSRVVFEQALAFLTSKGSPNLKRAKEQLGWVPLYRLEDGLQKTIDYAIANKEIMHLNNK